MKYIKLFIMTLFLLTYSLNAQSCTPELRFNGKKLNLTEKEWKQKLTPEQYSILREDGTEPAFKNKYYDNKKPGLYVCAACQLPLFSSKAKYKSGTGWPSFWEPICPNNVLLTTEYSLFFTIRTGVSCARCGSHIGHVFDDGPPPTGQRWCMNSLALNFIPQEQK